MIYINKTVFIATLILVLLAGLYGGYRVEKQKLDRMIGAKDSIYTQQINDLSTQNMKLTREVLMSKDHMTMQNGKMLLVNADGTSATMKVTVLLNTGDKVMPDGVIVRKDGTIVKLTDGASVWVDGTIMNSDGSMMTK